LITARRQLSIVVRVAPWDLAAEMPRASTLDPALAMLREKLPHP
jgi:hypothetical protein